MRYIEYLIVLGDAPPQLIANDIKMLSRPEGTEEDSTEEIEVALKKEEKDSLWKEGVIHPLSKETYFWNFSLVYREGIFDIIKWKSAIAWKEKKDEKEGHIMDKALFVGADGGVFFISIDEDIYDNFTKLANMMDVFLEKTKRNAPFLVYGLVENKQKIAELKTNKEMLKHVADVKKWATQHGGDFKIENLNEVKMNLSYLINEYAHYILTKFKTEANYSTLKVGEVHFLDYQDLTTLKEIETSLAEQAKAGQTIDNLLSSLVFNYLKMPEFQEEVIIPPPLEPVAQEEQKAEVVPPPPSKIKIILEEIRRGIRRQCPKCFNQDRTKIKEMQDKENIIMEFGVSKIYGWKYTCGLCGNIWRTEKFQFPKERK